MMMMMDSASPLFDMWHTETGLVTVLEISISYVVIQIFFLKEDKLTDLISLIILVPILYMCLCIPDISLKGCSDWVPQMMT